MRIIVVGCVLLAACGGDGLPSVGRDGAPDDETALDASVGSANGSKDDAEVRADGGDADAGSDVHDAGALLDGAVADDAAPDESDAGSDANVEMPDPDRVLAAAVEAKLRDCGIVGEGPFNVGSVEDSFDRCIGECITTASCEALDQTLCDLKSSSFSACNTACHDEDGNVPIPEDGYVCADGSRIPHTAVCDDGVVMDCPGGEDEQNCPKFTCADGDVISAKYRCDGYLVMGAQASLFGCKDGSDEVGCAPLCAD